MDFKEPKTLFDSAAKAVGANITYQALEIVKMWCTEYRNDIGYIRMLLIKTVEYYDTVIPKKLHDVVTNKALQYLAFRFAWIFKKVERVNFSWTSFDCFDSDSYESEVQDALHSALSKRLPRSIDLHIELSFLHICLRSHLSEFNFQDWPHEMHYALFKCLSRLKNLNRINLTSWKLCENYTYVIRAIQGMKNLEIFKCFDCTTDMLQIVCDNCPLKKLNVSFSNHITDTSLTSILKLQNLETLDILLTNFTEESIIEILLGLPHLRAISTRLLPSTLLQITDSSLKFGLLKVKYFNPTQEDLVNLTKYCPLIMKLKIYGSTSIDFSALSALKHLNVLLMCVSYLRYDDIKPLIQSIGHQITKLDIYDLDDISVSTVNEIKCLCPNLKIFFLDGKEKVL